MKKRLGIIGYGGQGAWHAGWANKSDVIELAGIYDINEKRCALARENGIKVYSTREEMLSDPTVDMVLCATPNGSHKEIVIAAAEAGKHVICEKPVAMSVADFDQMRATAEKCGVVFSVHQNRRWDLDYLAMKQLIETEEIGELINIESRVHGSRGVPQDWRAHRPDGGGMVYDWGVHLIDQMLILIPEKITGVYARLTHITTDEVDDGFTLMLDFESGKRATVEVGTYNFFALPRYYIQCRGGSAFIEDWQKNTQVAKLKDWCEKEIVPVQTAAGITKTMAPRDEVSVEHYEIPRLKADVHNFYRNLCDTIDGKCEQFIKNDEVRRVLLVMGAMFKSDECRQALKVNI